MHLYSIIETVLYVFYEAILNKSVYSLDKGPPPTLNHLYPCLELDKEELELEESLG